MLVLVHLPALGRVGHKLFYAPAEGSPYLALTGLALTVGFFVLKVIDVRFLRIGGPRGTVLAFILACAVVHRDAPITDAGRAAIGHVPALLATVLVVEALRRADHLRRRVRQWFTTAGVVLDSLTRWCSAPEFVSHLQPPQYVILTCLCAPRPPPAR